MNCPEAIAEYNKVMGGVDLADQKMGTYDLNRKSSKWWKRVFFRLTMLAVVNAHVLFQEVNNKKNKIVIIFDTTFSTNGFYWTSTCQNNSQTFRPWKSFQESTNDDQHWRSFARRTNQQT